MTCVCADPRDQGFPPTVRKFVLLSSIGVTRPEELGLLNTLAGNPLGWKVRALLGRESCRGQGGSRSVMLQVFWWWW